MVCLLDCSTWAKNFSIGQVDLKPEPAVLVGVELSKVQALPLTIAISKKANQSHTLLSRKHIMKTRLITQGQKEDGEMNGQINILLDKWDTIFTLLEACHRIEAYGIVL